MPPPEEDVQEEAAAVPAAVLVAVPAAEVLAAQVPVAEIPAAAEVLAEDPAEVLHEVNPQAQDLFGNLPGIDFPIYCEEMGRAEAGAAQFSDDGLDRWIVTNYGYECTWMLLPDDGLTDEESEWSLEVATFPNFRVVYSDGHETVGIAIVIKPDSESEEESEEEEYEDEKARIKAEENLLDFARVYNGNGIEFEIAGQRGTYYMNYGGGPEGGYFVVRPSFFSLPPFLSQFYKIRRNWGTAFDLNTRVDRVELVDDPDCPAGSGAKAVKVWIL